MIFDENQIQRYARHIVLPEVGGDGQSRLLDASVLIVGAGGLGSALILYLAAAGIGRLGIVDEDVVDLSNLQRQIVHDTKSVGMSKVDSAALRVGALNPDVRVDRHKERLTASNAMALIGAYDVVADGSDNFDTRYLVNDACYLSNRPLVSAAMLRFDAQIATFKAHEGPGHPCYRCVFPDRPPAGTVPSCAQAGVMGALAGLAGSAQALEVIKELLGIGESLSGHMLMIDALGGTMRKLTIRPDPACPLCGSHPTIADLSIHA
ncbi:MAG: HesA/MoeB/ThiF family protein [Inquilinaceae bacterium]